MYAQVYLSSVVLLFNIFFNSSDMWRKRLNCCPAEFKPCAVSKAQRSFLPKPQIICDFEMCAYIFSAMMWQMDSENYVTKSIDFKHLSCF